MTAAARDRPNLFRVLFYDAKRYDRDSFDRVLSSSRLFRDLKITYTEPRLDQATAALSCGFQCVCVFVNDILSVQDRIWRQKDENVLEQLYRNRVQLIALRCAGFDNVDVDYAHRRGLRLVRVPAYSPHGVAEFAIGLLLAVNRRIPEAFERVRLQNFNIEGLVGFNMFETTIGVIGTGKIGKCAISILRGMSCRVLAYDVFEDKEASKMLGFEYCRDLHKIWSEAQAIMLFAPLTDQTKHMINREALNQMKDGVIIVNTSRGGLIDTKALIEAIESGKVAGAALDVYENESEYFFRDLSDRFIKDNDLACLLRMDKVIVTSHHAYLTEDALFQIAHTTLNNIRAFIANETLENAVG